MAATTTNLNEVVEITVWLRVKGDGRKILHHAIKEIQKSEERNLVIRAMLAEADDKFSADAKP